MKKLIQLLWKELNRSRAIQFISYETADETQAKLQKELAQRKLQIMTDNYQTLMKERLIPYCRDLELSTSGMLLGDNQLFNRAHSMFLQAKADGKIDGLNRIVNTGEFL